MVLEVPVAIAMVLLLAAKLATIAVPFTFKWATDALVGEGTAPVAASSWLIWLIAAPMTGELRRATSLTGESNACMTHARSRSKYSRGSASDMLSSAFSS